MSAPFEHVDLATLMGSWPVLATYGGSPSSTPLPRVISDSATILGVVRESAAGFAVDGYSFYLWVDGTQYTVEFKGADPWTLAKVVNKINSDTSLSVASADNGFLRLTSPTTSETSLLRIQTDPASGSTVLTNLGLFAETLAQGGTLQQTQHVDPARQVALPGQLAWAEGEALETSVMNRVAFQLAVNADIAVNMLDKKRVAVKQELESLYSEISGSGSAGDGFTLPGYVYTGDYVGSDTDPTVIQLAKWFAILDHDGREFIQKKNITAATAAVGESAYTWDSENQEQVVTWATTHPFGDMNNYLVIEDYFITPAGLTGDNAALNNVKLKIIRYIGPTQVAVLSVDSFGTKYQITETPAGSQSLLTEVRTSKAWVKYVYDGPDGNKVANRKVARNTETITRIDRNNRIYCEGADFITSGVVPGDEVVWSSGTPSFPYRNNGTYKVASVVDKETLELVASDFGPVYLNPDTSGTLGEVDVTSDGYFWNSPFIVLDPDGAIPLGTDYVRILYLGMSTIKDASDDPAFFVGPGVRYEQEIDANVAQAILAILGPNATTIDNYVYGDRAFNLETIFDAFLAGHSIDGAHIPQSVSILKGVSESEGYRMLSFIEDNGTDDYEYYVGVNGTRGTFYVDAGGVFLVITTAGKVGIGYTGADPTLTYAFNVNGTIYGRIYGTGEGSAVAAITADAGDDGAPATCVVPGTGGTIVAAERIGIQSAPNGIAVVGDRYTDAKGRLLTCRVAGAPGIFVPVEGSYLANTSVETLAIATAPGTDFTHKYTIPANTLQVGQHLRIQAGLTVYSQTGNPQLDFYIFFAGAIVTHAIRASNAAGDTYWLEADITVTAIGSGTTVDYFSGLGVCGVPGAAAAAFPTCGTQVALDSTAPIDIVVSGCRTGGSACSVSLYALSVSGS